MATRIVAPGGASPSPTNKGTAPRRARKAPKAEMVSVPVLQLEGYRPSPSVDPYIRPDTLTTKVHTFNGVDLPPVFSGLQHVKGSGDYPVSVIWINRRQVADVLASVEQDRPDLRLVMEIVRSFMCHMDTIRDETKQFVLAARSWLKDDSPDLTRAREMLDGAVEMSGRWNDAQRLPLHGDVA